MGGQDEVAGQHALQLHTQGRLAQAGRKLQTP